MSGESRSDQLCRRYNITSSVLCHWKKQYSRGKFNNEPTEEGALKDRIETLERLGHQRIVLRMPHNWERRQHNAIFYCVKPLRLRRLGKVLR